MNTAEGLVQCLQADGVECIFGIPGEESSDFIMSSVGGGIRLVLMRYEQEGTLMAETYGWPTGCASVWMVTRGPEDSTLITGVAGANMDRAPMVVITGQADSQLQGKESHRNTDVVGVLRI